MGSSLSGPTEANKPKFLDEIRQLCACVITAVEPRKPISARRYILFHGKQHPRDLGESDIAKFLSSLAVEGRVAVSTQNQHVKASLTCQEQVKGRRVLRLRT